MNEIIGARLTPDIFGGTQELSFSFTWDTPLPPPEVVALSRVFATGEPFPVSIGTDHTARYHLIDATQDIRGQMSTLTIRLKRIIEETP
jgi:hypothetical protein